MQTPPCTGSVLRLILLRPRENTSRRTPLTQLYSMLQEHWPHCPFFPLSPSSGQEPGSEGWGRRTRLNEFPATCQRSQGRAPRQRMARQSMQPLASSTRTRASLWRPRKLQVWQHPKKDKNKPSSEKSHFLFFIHASVSFVLWLKCYLSHAWDHELPYAFVEVKFFCFQSRSLLQ